jgi:hypothetical protein
VAKPPLPTPSAARRQLEARVAEIADKAGWDAATELRLLREFAAHVLDVIEEQSYRATRQRRPLSFERRPSARTPRTGAVDSATRVVDSWIVTTTIVRLTAAAAVERHLPPAVLDGRIAMLSARGLRRRRVAHYQGQRYTEALEQVPAELREQWRAANQCYRSVITYAPDTWIELTVQGCLMLVAMSNDWMIRAAAYRCIIDLMPGLFGTVEVRERLRKEHEQRRPDRQRGHGIMVAKRTTTRAIEKTAAQDRYLALRREGFSRSEAVTMLLKEHPRFSGKYARQHFTGWLGVAALDARLKK